MPLHPSVLISSNDDLKITSIFSKLLGQIFLIFLLLGWLRCRSVKISALFEVFVQNREKSGFVCRTNTENRTESNKNRR
jgi:hypothetical protein